MNLLEYITVSVLSLEYSTQILFLYNVHATKYNKVMNVHVDLNLRVLNQPQHIQWF